ncbi:MAG: hypothetical protein HY741_01670 [Chloroflexi bacterium]|nr:hypothetical protein [Chloroflexota bacterium]
MSLATSQLALLQDFERGLDPQHPERSRVPARILGYGEISTVIEIQTDATQGYAFKRLPLFRDQREVECYRVVFDEYVRLLQHEIGVQLPAQDYAVVQGAAGAPVFYIVQQKLTADSIGSRVLHTRSDTDILKLVRSVLRELRKVWEFNHTQTRVQAAIDGQISNWAIRETDAAESSETFALRYVDTSTPLFRVNGVEQLDPELFLRSAPFFLAWLLRVLYLKDVVNRYYDFHLVATDLVANFYKEQRADLVPEVARVTNEFFATDARGLNVAPLDVNKVQAYYREDAQIWSLYFNARKTDRWLRTRVLQKLYPYILPDKIQR